MKKKLQSIILFLTLIVCVSGCGNQTTVDTDSIQTEDITETSEHDESSTDEQITENSVAFDDSILGEYYKDSGTLKLRFEETETYDYEYDYDIPMLNLDCDGAKKINEDIDNRYKAHVAHMEILKSGDYDLPDEPEFFKVSYETYWNDSLLSIIITDSYFYDDWKDYVVYNYDAATDQWLDSDALFALTGLDTNKALEYKTSAVSKVTKNNIDNYIADFSFDEGSSEKLNQLEMIDYMIFYALDSITNENLKNDLPMYFDENNQLMVIAPVCVPAGGGVYLYRMPLIEDETISDFSEYESFVNNPAYENHRKIFFQLYGEQGYSFENDEKAYYIGFDSENPTVFLYQENNFETGEGRNLSGNITWLGLDKNGHKFGFRISESTIARSMTDEVLGGEFYIKPYVDYSEENSNAEFKAAYQWISGDDLFDANHAPIELNLSFG